MRLLNTTHVMKLPATSKVLASIVATLLIASTAGASEPENPLTTLAKNLEHELGARVGLFAFDSNTGHSWGYRQHERFPLTSTFKPFACAAFLARVDRGEDSLRKKVSVEKQYLVTYSPQMKDFVDKEVTVEEACDAAITLSDNTAGNIVLEAIGGPKGLTEFLRKIGDEYSRLDRIEPDLNEATPGDPRDTTTPHAISTALANLLTTDALSPGSRGQLEAWMVNDRVADALFRSRLPEGWGIGDKTGAGGHGSRGFIAVIRPTDQRAVFAAVFITETTESIAARNSAIAEIGAKLFDELKLTQPLQNLP